MKEKVSSSNTNTESVHQAGQDDEKQSTANTPESVLDKISSTHESCVQNSAVSEEETKRSNELALFNDFADNAVSYIKGSFLKELEDRIENLRDFDRKIFKGAYKKTFSNGFEHCLKEGVVPDTQIAEFKKCVNGNCRPWCKRHKTKILKALMSVNESFINISLSFGYISLSDIKSRPRIDFSKTIQHLELEDIRKILELGYSKISSMFLEHNSLVKYSEVRIQEEAARVLLNTYERKMEDYMKFVPISTAKLQHFHDELVNKLQEASNLAFKPSQYSLKEFMIEGQNLSARLETIFSNLQKQNVNKIEALQKEISKIIAKLKTTYTTQIEQILSQKSMALDIKYLEFEHKRVLGNVLKSLQLQIHDKIRHDEPLDTHEAVLKYYANQYWSAVKATFPGQTDMHKNAPENREDARLPRSHNFEKLDTNETNTLLDAKPDDSRAQRPPHNHSLGEGKKLLNPLIFHLQSTRITMAMTIDNKMRVLKNEYKESYTPAFVAINAEGEFVYGSEAYNYSDSVPLRWEMADFFGNRHHMLSGEYNLGNQKHKISVEILIGFLLIKLKNSVEKKKGGKCFKACLIIPYWLSSRQRIQVKDAAKIAGFEEAFLINEASAAAYNFVFKYHAASEVLVICENFDVVDAFVYFYDESLVPKLKMLAHKQYKDIKNQSHGQTSRADDHVTKVKAICQDAISEVKKHRQYMQICEFLIVCEDTDTYKSCLINSASGIAINAKIQSDNCVLEGSCFLAKNISKIESWVSDLLPLDILVELKPVKISHGKRIAVKKGVPHGQKVHMFEKQVVEAEYFQPVFNDYHTINKIMAKDVPNAPWSSNRKIETIIEINHELIVVIQNIQLHEDSKPSRFAYPYQYNCNLTPDARQKLQMLLNYLISQKQSHEKTHESIVAKATLLKKCDEIKQKVEKGKFRIKSAVAKEMVLNTVKEAIKLAQHAEVSHEELENQMEALKKLTQKYE